MALEIEQNHQSPAAAGGGEKEHLSPNHYVKNTWTGCLTVYLVSLNTSSIWEEKQKTQKSGLKKLCFWIRCPLKRKSSLLVKGRQCVEAPPLSSTAWLAHFTNSRINYNIYINRFFFSLCFQVKILPAPEAPPPPLPASVHPSVPPSCAAHTSMSLCFPAAPAEELWKWKSAAPTARSQRAVRTRRDRTLVRPPLTLHHHRRQSHFPTVYICIVIIFRFYFFNALKTN